MQRDITKKHQSLLRVILVASLAMPALARTLSEAPMNIQAALLIKLLAYNENITQGGDLVIYVVNAPQFARSMKPAIGRTIGQSNLANIVVVEQIPSQAPEGPAVMYIGAAEQLEDALAYCRKHQILSITGVPALMDKGVTLRVGVENKKPAVLLSTALSHKEGVKWDSKVFSIASDE